MNDFEKRATLFLLGCIGVRYALTFVAKTQPEFLPLMGKLAFLPAVGFMVIYLFGLRKTGAETLGQPIWWNHLRPVHGTLWFVFAILAMNENRDAWKVLFTDTTIGLLAWVDHWRF